MKYLKHIVIGTFSFVLTASAFAQTTIQLPSPVKTGGMPLMEAFAQRLSAHGGYINEPLDNQTLADMLWAAYGFNRADKRTVPSAMNAQEFSVYVLMNNGAFLYDAGKNTLTEVVKGTFKNFLANQQQPYVNDVPVHLVFVGDVSKQRGGREAMLLDVGYISQNVYLYCASRGLGTCARASFDRNGLGKVLKLNNSQSVILVQAVGRTK